SSCTTNPGVETLAPAAAARKSLRRFSRSIAPTCVPTWDRGRPARPSMQAGGTPAVPGGDVRSRTEPLAAARATSVEHLATARSCHPGPEAMTALAHQLARLIGPLHGFPL